MKKIMLIALVLIFICIVGCYNDKMDQLYPASTTVTCDTTAVSFQTNVLPIFNTYCNIAGGCHNADGVGTSGHNYTNYIGIQSEANTTILVDDIKGTPTRGDHAMPLNLPPIPQCDIDIITAWVDQGAQNN